ncbi:hypothetical protein Mapa_015186 [Marchantia paleacea]|nr:hypothetical protein Mapa_015186 [Marchantia paleacea]
MPYAPPGGFHFEVIPADRWADQMLRHWKIAAYNKAANNDGGSVTLDDLEKPGADGQLNSPRSLQACLYLGIDPAELVHRPIDDFLERGLSPALQELKFQFYENSRLVQRIEVVRRRQQRELEQVAKYEALRQQLAEQNAATMEMEKRRREEQKKAKAAKDKAWQAEMRARELQRAKEEAELEAEAKRMAQERYAREQAKMEADERKAKQAKKEARLREIERAQKQEEFRAQLEKTQEEFREAARERGRKMEARDQERRKNLAVLKKIKQEENAEIRRMMEKRHDDALAAWHRMIQKKADDYNAKQAEIKQKMKLKYEVWKKKEAEKKAYLEKKEQERLDTIAEANAIRERRCQELLGKAEEQDRNLHNYMVQKHLDEARRTVEKELIHEAKRQRCEALKRIQALHRRQILEKIEMETQRIRNLLDGKQQMLTKHVQANLNLVIHRQSMIEQMQELSISKKWRQSLSPESREEMDKLKDAQKGFKK